MNCRAKCSTYDVLFPHVNIKSDEKDVFILISFIFNFLRIIICAVRLSSEETEKYSNTGC